MSQNKSMSKNQSEKQSQGSTTIGSGSLAEKPPTLCIPDLTNLTYSLSESTDSPPSSPPPPPASYADDPSSSNTTTRPGTPPADTIPEFGNKEKMFFSPCDYGEPMRPQHLVVDFTPIEGVDDDAYNMKKVLDFWKFIRSLPELDRLRASPEEWDESENGEDFTNEDSENDGSERPGTVHNAIPWMKCDHVMSTAFAARQTGRYCEQGGGGGGGGDFAPQPHKITKKSGSKAGTRHSIPGCGSKQHSEGLGYPVSSQVSAPQVDVHTLCKQLEEWDHFHPRVLSAWKKTGHAASLLYVLLNLIMCVMGTQCINVFTSATSTLEPPATPPKRGYNNTVLQRKI